MRNAPHLIQCSNKIDIFIGRIACTVRMFHHDETHLLPHARRITQHRDRTRRGNSAFPFQLVFRIRSCVFSFGAHISCWSRTRDTTLIRGLNHRWNRTIVNRNNSSHDIVESWCLEDCENVTRINGGAFILVALLLHSHIWPHCCLCDSSN